MLRIHDWDKWQSYRRDRQQPPWIKVHRTLMRDPKWIRLTSAERGELVCLWMLAADRDGLIPSDAQMIKKICCLDDAPDLERFIDLGFLEQAVENPATVRPSEPDDDEVGTGKVYFVRYNCSIKIGFSKNPWARIAALRTAMPGEPELLGHVDGTKDDERRLHRLFAPFKRTREWFDANPDLEAVITTCLTTGELPRKLPATYGPKHDAPETETETETETDKRQNRLLSGATHTDDLKKPPPENQFAEWYAVYPRRKARRAAEKAYQAALKRGATHEQLMAGARRYSAECVPKERQFIALPATWLNGDRHLDEPETNGKSTLYVIGNKRVKITESGERIELDGPVGEEANGGAGLELDAVDQSGDTTMGRLALVAARERPPD